MSEVKHAEDCRCRACTRRRNEPTKDRCSCCGKYRLCQQVTVDKLTGPKTWDPRYCVRECLKLTGPERTAKRAEEDAARREARQDAPPLAWPIIGGPLDGKFAVPADFYREGRHAEHGHDYTEWNAASGGNRRIGGFPTMIFVHRTLTPGMIRGRDR